MLKKDAASHKLITADYIKHWETNGVSADNDDAREVRKSSYMSLVNNYYDIVTDLYEEGWAQSFHLCRIAVGESLLQALARHEHYLAYKIGIQEDMTVLDVGCGVGKPAREIATFTGCNVVGLNNNSYQIERATAHAKREELSHKVSFVKGDFMEINLPENTFDAVYAIEATVHAPSLESVYTQIHRVLKPGGTFGLFEWVMNDKYDDSLASHRAIRLGIERGNGISNMVPRKSALEAIKAAGFTVEYEEDLAQRPDSTPWYAPLDGDFKNARTAWDFLTGLRLTTVGRYAIGSLLRTLEAVRVAPPGTAQTAHELSLGADSLVAGGKQGLFTPMYLMIAKKPMG